MTTPRRVDGADVSHHQGELDLVKARNSGLRFLYHKATEGDSFVDPEYAARRKDAERINLPFGGYHFARAERGDAIEEARHFIRTADPRVGDLIPALDLETTEGLTAAELKVWAKSFSDEVERLVGVRPVFYSPWNLGLRGQIRWVPRYNDTNTPPTIPWDVWQFSDGQLGVPDQHPGLGHVDLNTFRQGFELNDLRIPAKRRKRPLLKYVTFNAWIGQKKDALERNLRELAKATGNPPIIVVQEVWDWEGTIPGYKAVRAPRSTSPGSPWHRSTIILVRNDVKILHEGGQAVRGGEWNYNGNPKEARVYPRVVIRHKGRIWDIIGIHRVPLGPRPPRKLNRDAWRAEHTFIQSWVNRIAERFIGRTILLLGDWNTQLDDLPQDDYSLASLCEDIDADAAVLNIDGALVVNGEIVRTRKLTRGFGSDGHRPVVGVVRHG